MGKNGRDQGRENDVEGLTWLHKFGWLRSRELAKLIFVTKLTQEEIKNENNIKNSKKYAERLCNKWVKKGYVIKRRLPDSSGNAYVLASAGVQFLADKAGIEAKSNKDWGETKNKIEWIPPREWEHDLAASRILIELHVRYECNIVPEYQIRRENPKLSKIPDGLYSNKENNKNYYWLEVERSRKTGGSLERMINAIYPLTTHEKRYDISNRSVCHAAVAYDSNAKDENNHNLNHKFRVISALKKIGKKDMNMIFIEFDKTSNHFLKADKAEKIENDEITRQVRFFEKRGWDEYSQGVQLLQMGDTEMWVRKQKDQVEWEVNDEQRDFKRTGTTTTISDAKRAVAAIYTEFAELLNRQIPHHLRRR